MSNVALDRIRCQHIDHIGHLMRPLGGAAGMEARGLADLRRRSGLRGAADHVLLSAWAICHSVDQGCREASGGITLDTIAATGVDYASSGWITHSAPNLDVALDIEM